MMDTDYTIVIPEFCYPNRLAVSLRGLAKYSALRPKIIVVYSNPDEGEETARLHVNDWQGNQYQPYSSIPDYIERNKDFIETNNIEFHDITERTREFKEDFLNGKIGNGAVQVDGEWEYSGGVDTAFKDMCGLELVRTPWVVMNWDDDFYPGPGWDINTLKYAESFGEKFPNNKSIFMPTHVQAVSYDQYPGTRELLPIQDQWEDMRKFVKNVILWPSGEQDPNLFGVNESDWLEWCDKWKKMQAFVERPGERDRAHWVPVFYRTDKFLNITG